MTVEFGRGGRGRKKKHRGTGGGLRVLVLVLALVLFRQGAGEARANLKHHSDLSESDRSEWCLRFALASPPLFNRGGKHSGRGMTGTSLASKLFFTIRGFSKF